MSENRFTDTVECRRCGICCCKGGPALHGTDLELVLSGAIPLSRLFTIRPGEMVRDNVCGRVSIADADIIKIKSSMDGAACIFYDETDNSCRIYVDRPLECREMACRDTEAIRRVYAIDRLDRRRVLAAIPALIELIGLHENECGMAVINGLVNSRNSGDKGAAAEIAEKIGYDATLRERVAAARTDSEDFMEFLFGRPLHQIVPLQFNIPVRQIS